VAGVEHRAFIHVSPELVAPACANGARLDLSVLRLHAGLGARLHGVRRGVEALARANQEYVYLKKPDPMDVYCAYKSVGPYTRATKALLPRSRANRWSEQTAARHPWCAGYTVEKSDHEPFCEKKDCRYSKSEVGKA
jgi:hypothetical protein